jgi:hypothetical protein
MSTVERTAKDALAAAQDRILEAAEQGDLDQHRAPMLEALRAYHECEPASFSIPAHKAGRSLDELTRDILGDGPYRADAPMHKGLDDRVSSYKVQSFAQQLAADAFGAEQALFSTNGSTLSVQIAVMATTHPGQKVAVARNVHKSVISGLILSGANPVFVDPVYDDQCALAHTVTPKALEAALDAHPDVKAMLAVSPTVAGVAADVTGLAQTCHARGIPLIMDDAWGADFSFHPDLPPGSMECGADLAVASFHKSLTGLMQTSIILVQGERIDIERLQLALDGFETTSTSALLVASMDATRHAMALHGQELLDRALTLSRRGGERIGALPGIRLLGPEFDGRAGVAARDETKIFVDVTGLGITGFQAADWLYGHRRVGAEHHDLHHVMSRHRGRRRRVGRPACRCHARPGPRRTGDRSRPGASVAATGLPARRRLRHGAARGLPRHHAPRRSRGCLGRDRRRAGQPISPGGSTAGARPARARRTCRVPPQGTAGRHVRRRSQRPLARAAPRSRSRGLTALKWLLDVAPCTRLSARRVGRRASRGWGRAHCRAPPVSVWSIRRLRKARH